MDEGAPDATAADDWISLDTAVRRDTSPGDDAVCDGSWRAAAVMAGASSRVDLIDVSFIVAAEGQAQPDRPYLHDGLLAMMFLATMKIFGCHFQSPAVWHRRDAMR